MHACMENEHALLRVYGSLSQIVNIPIDPELSGFDRDTFLINYIQKVCNDKLFCILFN